MDTNAPSVSHESTQQELNPSRQFLIDSIASPLTWVYGAFDWGSGELRPKDDDPEPGPDRWQIDVLLLIEQKHLTISEALQIAVSSGHGIGKSALIAWIILWFITTRANCNGIVTANTGKQLTGKTWREVGVWLRRIKPPILEECPLVMTATKLYHSLHERTWFINAIEWSEKNPEAFAGLHGDHVLVLFDEGSAIPQTIWDTTSGAMTTAGAMWIVFGNPTRNNGAFFECFHKYRHRWITRQIDSRTAKKTGKKQIENWVQDYGEDSDFVRVRVRGVFPRAGSSQFISHEIVEAAQRRYRDVGALKIGQRHELCFGPKLLGIDVARFGDDASTIWFRHGNYARRLARYVGLDTTQLTGFIIDHIEQYEPDTTFIDGTGLGAGVVDQVRNRGYAVAEVIGSAKPQDERTYKNLRAEMWGKMRDWLKTGAVEDLTEMRDDLTGPEYFFDNHQAIQLESKDDMKGRGLASPDNGDALAQTFAYKVTARSAEDARRRDYGSGKRNQGSAWTA